MPLGVEESLFLAAAAALLLGALMRRWRAYRSLLTGAGMLLLITALIPRPGNTLGAFLFSQKPVGIHLPLQFFGLAWWILGAWLVKSLLDLVLRRTIFPNDNQPHTRRLFADLASGLVYIIALVGIVETVLKQPISAVLATSGVLAIVLGLALQNTLADVFSGIAINIGHSFRAGDWITMNGAVEGEIMEINWRATLIRSAINDIIVIPNSIVAKAIVTNHRRLNRPHVCTIGLTVDNRIPSDQVIAELRKAARASPGVAANFDPTGYAVEFTHALVSYQLCFGIDDFKSMPKVQSAVIGRVMAGLRQAQIPVGAPPLEVIQLAAPVATPLPGKSL